MIKKILLPLDGSHSALSFAIHLAKKSGAVISALAIVDEPEILLPEPVPMGAGEFVEHKQKVLIEKSHEHNKKLINEFKKKCEKEFIKFVTIEKTGHPYEEIVHFSHEHDIIVMPQISHYKSITQEGPCETSSQVLHHTSRPMFLIPEKYHPGKDVYITYDGGKAASKTMQMALMSGILNEFSVTAFAVSPELEIAKEHCLTVKSFLNGHDIHAKELPLESTEKAWNVLLDSIKSSHPDFITMGAFERSAIKEFFIGSFTQSLVEKSPVPLFIYH